MQKKYIIREFVIAFIIAFLSSCHNEQVKSSVFKGKAMDFINYGSNDTITTDKFLFPRKEEGNIIRDIKYTKTVFTFCKNSIQLEGKSISNLELENITLTDINFLRCKINNLIVRNCQIGELNFSNARIESLSIVNSSISNTVFYECTGQGLIIDCPIDSIKNASILSCNLVNCVFSGNIKKLQLERGVIEKLDVSAINPNNCTINLRSPQLINPKLFVSQIETPSILPQIDFGNAIFTPDSRSVLMEELEADELNTSDSYNTDRVVIRNHYQNARASYLILANSFSGQKRMDVADYFEYRSKVCERKASVGQWADFWGWLYNEKIRGNYGTNSLEVAVSIIWIFILFTVIYFILGCFHISFGYYINVNFSGQIIEDAKPKIIVIRKGIRSVALLMKHCFLFSLNQMLLGGIPKDYHIYDFASKYLFPPRFYKPLGIGRYFALLQSLVGLFMVFFLISAFLKLSK
jgi:uncharacterized protein YjbI with pentapeptide repeats